MTYVLLREMIYKAVTLLIFWAGSSAWKSARLASERPRVQIPAGPPLVLKVSSLKTTFKSKT